MASRRVLYVQYTNPAGYPPLLHSAHLLADQGFSIRFLGTDALADSLRFPRHDRVEVRLMPFQAGGWRQKVHYARFALWVMATAASWRPSWIYASDPLSSPIALLLKQLLGMRVVYHEHDSPSPQASEGLAGTRFVRLVMKARRALAQKADVCVLPNAERARLFTSATGRSDVLTVWNCPARSEIASGHHEASGQTLRVLYHGSIVPARVPKSVLEGVALTPPGVTLTLIGYETAGHARYIRELTESAAKLGIADRVRFDGPMSRADLMACCANFDVGLALLPIDSSDINERSMVGASNKPFDYMACGLSLLVSESREWIDTYVSAGFGRSCDPGSAASIAGSLQWFLDHPKERQAMGERGQEQIASEWNYEKAFGPVVTRLLSNAADWPERVPSVDPIG
jgi:glycosyltransferase involved in cell wall biosynthesis